MHRFFFQRLGLCDEQGETPLATSGAPEPAAQADDAIKLTIGQRLSAALASKESLQAKILEQTSKLADQATTITDLQAQLAEATARVTKLEADAAEVEAALKAAEAESATLKAQAKTADQLAKEKVAALGFPAAQLPAANDAVHANAEEEIASLRTQISKTTDPQKRGELVAKIQKLKQDPARN